MLVRQVQVLKLKLTNHRTSIENKELKFCVEDPSAKENHPRNLFVWRSNLIGSSSKGHEYFLKYLLGTKKWRIRR